MDIPYRSEPIAEHWAHAGAGVKRSRARDLSTQAPLPFPARPQARAFRVL
jgi:hypothetical protein